MARYSRPVFYMPPASLIEGSADKLFRAVIDGRKQGLPPELSAWFVGLRFYPSKQPAVIVRSVTTKESGEQLVESIRAVDLEAVIEGGGWDPIRVGLETTIEVRVSGPCDVVGVGIQYQWDVEEG